MSEYKEFFEKRNAADRKKKNFSKRPEPKGSSSHPIWLILVATILAGGTVWYLCAGEEQTSQILGKLEVTLMGEASAEDHKETKAAEASAKTEEKSAASDSKEKAKEPAQEKAAQKSWTDEEITLFTKLEARKKQLDSREADLNKLEEELQKQKEEIEKRLGALEEVRHKIATKLEDKVKVDQQKVDSLISVYTNMKPSQAAKVISGINEDLAVEVLGKMKNKAAAEILNLMDSDKAKKLSERFAGFRDPAASK